MKNIVIPVLLLCLWGCVSNDEKAALKNAAASINAVSYTCDKQMEKHSGAGVHTTFELTFERQGSCMGDSNITSIPAYAFVNSLPAAEQTKNYELKIHVNCPGESFYNIYFADEVLQANRAFADAKAFISKAAAGVNAPLRELAYTANISDSRLAHFAGIIRAVDSTYGKTDSLSLVGFITKRDPETNRPLIWIKVLAQKPKDKIIYIFIEGTDTRKLMLMEAGLLWPVMPG